MSLEHEVARIRQRERLRRAAEHRLARPSTVGPAPRDRAGDCRGHRPGLREVLGHGLLRAGMRVLESGRSSA